MQSELQKLTVCGATRLTVPVDDKPSDEGACSSRRDGAAEKPRGARRDAPPQECAISWMPAAESRALTPQQTRILALAPRRSPIPSLTKRSIERRWQVGPDSVRKILREFGVDPGKEKSLLVPLTDVLRCEGFSDPLRAWISASQDGRIILTADLLTLDDRLKGAIGKTARDRSGYYRKLSEGLLESIRIGKQHRFRPTFEAARMWHDLNVGAST